MTTITSAFKSMFGSRASSILAAIVTKMFDVSWALRLIDPFHYHTHVGETWSF